MVRYSHVPVLDSSGGSVPGLLGLASSSGLVDGGNAHVESGLSLSGSQFTSVFGDVALDSSLDIAKEFGRDMEIGGSGDSLASSLELMEIEMLVFVSVHVGKDLLEVRDSRLSDARHGSVGLILEFDGEGGNNEGGGDEGLHV